MVLGQTNGKQIIYLLLVESIYCCLFFLIVIFHAINVIMGTRMSSLENVYFESLLVLLLLGTNCNLGFVTWTVGEWATPYHSWD